jgi:glycosyltransferase involved in cell wall biosynthesis
LDIKKANYEHNSSKKKHVNNGKNSSKKSDAIDTVIESEEKSPSSQTETVPAVENNLKKPDENSLKKLNENTEKRILINKKKYLKSCDIYSLLPQIVDAPILICSTQYPGYGGGATNAYNIYKFLLMAGFTNVACAFFIHEKLEQSDSFNHNPDNLTNVFYFIRQNLDADKVREKIAQSLKGNPLILCKNTWVATEVPKILPDARCMYLVSGSKILTQKMVKTAECYTTIMPIDLTNINQSHLDADNGAAKKCEYVLCNSDISNEVTMHTIDEAYKTRVYKLYTTFITAIITSIKYDTSNHTHVDRHIDLIFVASKFSRIIKGPTMAKKIFTALEASKMVLSICVIGDEHELLDLRNTDTITYTCVSKTDNKSILEYMYNSKILLLPSLYEACPNTMHEAITMGAQVVTSNNVGSHEVLDADSIVEDYHSASAWVDTIKLKLSNPCRIDMEYCTTTVSTLFRLVYEHKLKTDTVSDFTNVICVDYDLIKMSSIKDIIKLCETGYVVVLPNSLTKFYTNIEDKYKAQFIKMVSNTNKLNNIRKSSSTRKDIIAHINANSDDYCIFTNSSVDTVNRYFVKVKTVNTVTQLKECKHLALVLSYPIPFNLVSFINDISGSYKSVIVMSSLYKDV